MTLSLLPHQLAILQQVELARKEVAITGCSRGVLLIGPSGSGKTFLFKLLEEQMPSTRTNGQLHVPFCGISLGAASDPTTILRRILARLGKPENATIGCRLAELEWQVLDALDACKVEVLAIEEFHNALLKNELKFRRQVNRLIKHLWNADNRGKRVILISGTDEIITAFDSDDELNSRFSNRVYAVSLWFNSPEITLHFRGVAGSILDRHAVGHLIDLQDNLTLSRLLFACRGHLRRLDSLCARVSTLEPTMSINGNASAIWSAAFLQSVAKAKSPAEDPFSWSDDELRRRVRAQINSPRP